MTSRRTVRLLATALTLGLVLGACGDGDPAAADAVVIGVLTSRTGPFTVYGVQAEAGMRMAADELNADGGIEGRPVRLVTVDDRNDVDEGVTGFERLVEVEGAVAVGGVISSSVGVAVAQVAEELQVPFLPVKAGSEALLTRDSRMTFRTCLPAAPMIATPLLQYARARGVGRVGAVVADYAWGRSIEAALEEAFDGSGVDLLVEVAGPPGTDTDFTPYLRPLLDAPVGMLVATGHPSGAASIAVQAADLGLDAPVVGPYAALGDVVSSIGSVAIDGYVDFSCADVETEEYRALATRFAEANPDLGFMEADAVAGYGLVQAVADAVAVAGDDPAAVADALRTGRTVVPGLAHPLAWTEWGELAEAAPTLSVIRSTNPPDGVNPGAGWYPEVLVRSAPLEPYEPR